MITSVILYHTEGCHLCEVALSLITPFSDDFNLTVKYCDIIDDPDALENYAVHIPVLADSTQQKKLFWPFDAAAISQFLQGEVVA